MDKKSECFSRWQTECSALTRQQFFWKNITAVAIKNEIVVKQIKINLWKRDFVYLRKSEWVKLPCHIHKILGGREREFFSTWEPWAVVICYSCNDSGSPSDIINYAVHYHFYCYRTWRDYNSSREQISNNIQEKYHQGSKRKWNNSNNNHSIKHLHNKCSNNNHFHNKPNLNQNSLLQVTSSKKNSEVELLKIIFLTA